MARLVLVHSQHGHQIFEAHEAKEKIAEGWQETKINPEAQEDAEAFSEHENGRDQDERAAEHLAAQIEAVGGQEKWDELQKRKEKAKAKSPPKDPSADDEPKSDGKAKGGRGKVK